MQRCILIIEDSPTSQAVASYLFEAAGYRVLTAGSGELGIAIARLWRPDLVLCDIHLPGIDGFDVARAFAGDTTLSAIPLLAYTASDEPGFREKMTAAGFAGYIAKPISREFIRRELVSYLAPGRRPSPNGDCLAARSSAEGAWDRT